MSYKTTCPKCGGNDFYVTPHNGVGYCFHCAYVEHNNEEKTSTTYTPKHSVQEIRQLYTALTRYYHSCITEPVRVYLNSRGFTDDMIQELKLGYIPDEAMPSVDPILGKDSGLYINGKAVLGNRIAFPYLFKDTVTDIRGRAVSKEDPIRYKSPVGTATARGADYPYNSKDMNQEHIITEGEIKAAISSQYGVPCVSLPGIIAWRPKLVVSQKQIIIFDSTKNRATREITYKAIDKLAMKLTNPYVAALPLRGQDKMDIDTFILMYGIEEFKAITSNALIYDEWAKIQRRTYVH
jgi:DNA primase